MIRIYRRFLYKQAILAYHRGLIEGMRAERERNDDEWDRFFEDAKLKNTISGNPIRSRKDFYEWKKAYDAAKEERQKRADEALKKKRSGVHYMAETPDGDVLCVRGDQLSAFMKVYGTPKKEGAGENQE
jgi:hypothetical protein